MKLKAVKYMVSLAVSTVGLEFSPRTLHAQPAWPVAPPPMMSVPTTPNAQRNALNNVRTQVGWLRNATRTAQNYTGESGAYMLWQQFQTLRGAYRAFTMTLNPQQQAYGANELSELEAGLDIIQEAFKNYQDDVAGGRSATTALSDLCRLLQDASAVWLQELTRDCSRLRVGY